MSQHARIEELSDSDSDPPEDDIDSHIPSLIRPSDIPAPAGVPASHFAERSQSQFQPPRQQPPAPFQSSSSGAPPEYKQWQTLYPLYFDAARTRTEGRRVGAEHAVPNPLAREIMDAVQAQGLKTVFEPGKMHPKDWSNPGRVKVLVKEGGRARNARVKNSMSSRWSCLRLGREHRLWYLASHGADHEGKQKAISTFSCRII